MIVTTELEITLLAISRNLVILNADTKKRNEFMEALTDANKSLAFIHKQLIPLIQEFNLYFNDYLTNLPKLLEDVVQMSEEVRLSMVNNNSFIERIDKRLEQILTLLIKNLEKEKE